MRIDRFIQQIEQVIDEVTGKENVRYKCAVISEFARFVLASEGKRGTLVLGEFIGHPDGETHNWLIVEGVVLDFTLQQFGVDGGPVVQEDFYRKHYIAFAEEEDYLFKDHPLFQEYVTAYTARFSEKNTP